MAPPIDGKVFLEIMEETREVLKAIQDTGGGALFGAAPNERIPTQGEELDTATAMPVAAVTWMEELADDLDNKITHRLPWHVEVYFDSSADGNTLRERHALMMGRVKNAFMNNRKINGKVVDTSYLGGGTALTPMDTEQTPDRWKFTVRFESQYRHLLTESGIPA